MNNGENTQIKKVWNTPILNEISVEETLSGRYPFRVVEDFWYIS